MGIFSDLIASAGRRVMLSVDAAAARAERATIRGADAVITLAEATAKTAQAVWRPAPPSTSLTQILPVNVSQWSVPEVVAALDAFERGSFLDAAGLVDAMGRDDRISGCLNTRVRALAGKSGVGFTVEPSAHGDDAAFNKAIAEKVLARWWQVFPESVLSRILRDAVMYGVAVCRIHWELVDGMRVPRLEPWDMHGIFWNWAIRRYQAVAQEGVFTIDPFSGEWFVFEPAGYRSWMLGAVRGLGIPWVIRKMTFRDWARYSEKHGLPIIAINEPAGTQWERHKGSFWSRVRQLGVETTLRLPKDDQGNGFDVKLIEPTSRSENAFRMLIERLDINIAVHLLGQNLSTEVSGGSFAAAAAHNLVRLDCLDADAQTLATAIRESIIKAFLRFNFAGVDEECAPWPTWSTRPPEDKQAAATIFSTVVSAIVQGRSAGVEVPPGWVETSFSIPVKLKDPPAPPGGPGGPPGGGPPGAPGGGGNGPAPAEAPKTAKPGAKPVDAAPEADDEAEDDEEDEAPPLKQKAPDQPKAAKAEDPQMSVETLDAAPPTRTIAGVVVHIDRPRGTVQTGTSPDGTPWSRTYRVDYGEIPGTAGGDGDPIDVFCGDEPAPKTAWWILQRAFDGSFDELKLMLGFATMGDAVACYLDHCPAQLLGPVVPMPLSVLRGMLGMEPEQQATALTALSTGKQFWKARRRKAEQMTLHIAS